MEITRYVHLFSIRTMDIKLCGASRELSSQTEIKLLRKNRLATNFHRAGHTTIISCCERAVENENLEVFIMGSLL